MSTFAALLSTAVGVLAITVPSLVKPDIRLVYNPTESAPPGWYVVHPATQLEVGDYVIAHGRFSGNGRPAAWIAADIIRIEDGKLAEHWDVLQDEAMKAESVSGLPMFGDRFPA